MSRCQNVYVIFNCSQLTLHRRFCKKSLATSINMNRSSPGNLQINARDFLHPSSSHWARARAPAHPSTRPGRKVTWLAREHFDKFTSEISASYENNMKSYLTLPLACWQARSWYMGKYLSHMNTTYPIPSCLVGKPPHMNRTKLFVLSNVFSLTGIMFSNVNRP